MRARNSRLHILLTRTSPIRHFIGNPRKLILHVSAAILSLPNNLHFLHSPHILPQKDLEDVAFEVQPHILNPGISEQLLSRLFEVVLAFDRLGGEEGVDLAEGFEEFGGGHGLFEVLFGDGLDLAAA